MSKDGKDSAADTDADERPKRRRKGGLRVPSDNVPRKGGDSRPASDPRLAVSVAYAFGEGKDSDDEPTEVEEEAPVDPSAKTEELAAQRPATGDSVDIAFDDLDEEEGVPTEPKRSKGKDKKHWPRVQTETLSDSDLESMMTEAETAEPEDQSRTPTLKLPTVARPPASDEEELKPGDSGEILTDELLEEVNEASEEEAEPEASESEADASREVTAPMPVVRAPSEPARKPPPAPPSTGAARAAVAAAVTSEPESGRKKRKFKPWYEEIFDEDYLRTLPFLTPQSTQFEANFVVESLNAEAGTQILDVGCGYGRHAMELAARGFHVVGLDSSLPLLLRGADEAQRRGLNINFVHGDMREITFESQFDGAYCLFSTFGYFDDDTNKKTAQNISRALKPGARFVVEVLNRDYLISDLPSRVWWEGDGCVVLEEVDFNYFSSRILSNRSVVFDDGRQLEQEISIRAYSLHELGKLLHAAGFRVIEVSGSMYGRGRYFGGKSRDIVVVAEKREAKGDIRLPRAHTEPGVG